MGIFCGCQRQHSLAASLYLSYGGSWKMTCVLLYSQMLLCSNTNCVRPPGTFAFHTHKEKDRIASASIFTWKGRRNTQRVTRAGVERSISWMRAGRGPCPSFLQSQSTGRNQKNLGTSADQMRLPTQYTYISVFDMLLSRLCQLFPTCPTCLKKHILHHIYRDPNQQDVKDC